MELIKTVLFSEGKYVDLVRVEFNKGAGTNDAGLLNSKGVTAKELHSWMIEHPSEFEILTSTGPVFEKTCFIWREQSDPKFTSTGIVAMINAGEQITLVHGHVPGVKGGKCVAIPVFALLKHRVLDGSVELHLYVEKAFRHTTIDLRVRVVPV